MGIKAHESEKKKEKESKTALQAQQVRPRWYYLEFFLTFNLWVFVSLFL